MAEKLPVRDALLSFVAREPLRAALFLTYSFDGRWFEDAIVPDLCDRPITTMLVVRDRNAIASEAPSVRYRKANACASAVFHPKLVLLLAEDSGRAVISSANLTRGGFERQRELGRVFDLSPSSNADHSLFVSLADYLQNGVASEVRGDAARDLANIVSALRAVIERCKPPPGSTPHALLHNYAEPIWTQVLNRLPHRVLRRAIIVSPFFEPDRRNPEDPALGPHDASIFARMLFNDFEFESAEEAPPVQVFFRQSDGLTELPIRKLRRFNDKIAFFAQDEREQRLHAKLVILEGAEGKGRKPFLIALHGSPNFTTAGLINQPPNGNSELAVLTTLPAKRTSVSQTIHLLGLERGFNRVDDLSTLRNERMGKGPEPVFQGVADSTYLVAEQAVKVTLLQAVPNGGLVRILLQRDGSWIVIGEASTSGSAEMVIPVIGMAEIDVRTNLLELRGMNIRVEVVGTNGQVLASHSTPINVDVPEAFCGLTMVGSALLTLDERIARAGIGAPITYREQQKWLEARKERESAGVEAVVVEHQADLDRFYRNVHQGLRGILSRAKATPGSEFTIIRSLDELTRWTVEAATNEGTVLSRECRLFLVERLLQGSYSIVEGSSPAMKPRIPTIATALRIAERLARVFDWLDQIDEPALAVYAAGSHARLRHMLRTFKNGVER